MQIRFQGGLSEMTEARDKPFGRGVRREITHFPAASEKITDVRSVRLKNKSVQRRS